MQQYVTKYTDKEMLLLYSATYSRNKRSVKMYFSLSMVPFHFTICIPIPYKGKCPYATETLLEFVYSIISKKNKKIVYSMPGDHHTLKHNIRIQILL